VARFGDHSKHLANAVLAPSASLAAAWAPNSQEKAPAGKKKAASGSSLSGCVDQQEGHYVLVDDRSLSPVADLEADGFPTEGFGKHMGHKVTIRGTSGSEREFVRPPYFAAFSVFRCSWAPSSRMPRRVGRQRAPAAVLLRKTGYEEKTPIFLGIRILRPIREGFGFASA
jgi:hypothetical protein